MIGNNPQRPEVPVRRRMILVTGMHRSGTSAVTRALSMCGAALPSDLVQPNFANPDGFWEPAQVVRLHDELLTSIGFTWDDTREFPANWFDTQAAASYRDRLWQAVDTDLLMQGPLLVKDPRLCRLVPLWLRIGQEHGVEMSFVIPLRNPLDVARSLAQRDQMPHAKALLLWLRHFLEAEQATRGARRCFLSYERLMQNGVATIEPISHTLDLTTRPLPAGVEAQVEGFLNTSRWHHRHMSEERAPDWVKRAHAWGLAAARGDAQDAAALDAISDELRAADAIYRPLLELRDDRATELERRVSDHEATIRALEAARAEWDDERRAFCDERQTLHQQRHELFEERRDLLATQQTMSQALAQAEQTRELITTSTCWRLSAPLRTLAAFLRRSPAKNIPSR